MTDLGTRLVSPWRDEVVIEHGPPLSERLDQGRSYLNERGDHLVDQGRQTLNRGIAYAGHLAEQARARLPEVDAAAHQARTTAQRAARTLRTRLPDPDDAADLARTGARQARRYAEDVRSRLPTIDPADIARSGRRLANDAYATMEDQRSNLSRAVKRLFA